MNLKFLISNFQKDIMSKLFTLSKLESLLSSMFFPISLHPYGSFMFHEQNDADIDVLILTSCEEEQFYKRLTSCELLQNLTYIKSASVPIIKFDFLETAFDLIIVNNLTFDQLFNPQQILTLDAKTLRKISGLRTTIKLLTLIPNLTVFGKLLTTVKSWAKQCQIYGQTYGFLGGIAWSILVAKICQLFDNPSLSDFFHYYSAYNWSKPLTLCEPEDHRFNIFSWQPTKHRPSFIKILIPISPLLNTAHHLTHSTNALTLYHLTHSTTTIVPLLPSPCHLLIEGQITIPLRWLICQLEKLPQIRLVCPQILDQSIRINLIFKSPLQRMLRGTATPIDLSPLITQYQTQCLVPLKFQLVKPTRSDLDAHCLGNTSNETPSDIHPL